MSERKILNRLELENLNAEEKFIEEITPVIPSSAIIRFLKWIWNPKPKKADELQEAYKRKFDEIYKKERIKFLEKKAEDDAKKKAQQDGSLGASIRKIITGGRA